MTAVQPVRLTLKVELRDAPGQLSLVLQEIGEHGGNVESVTHRRDLARGEWVPVEVAFRAPADAAERLVDALRSEVRVLEASGASVAHPVAFILVGHVFQENVQDVTDALFEAGCRVHRVHADIAHRDAPSAVLFDATADTAAARDDAIHRVESLANAKGLTVIRSLPEVAE